MIKSMTGYGRAVETLNGREFTVEVRSVNNRYLDCSVKLPRSLSFGEEAVKQAVKRIITRGKVDISVTVASETGSNAKVILNTGVVEGYLQAMREMVEKYQVRDDISVSALSRLPEVFTVERPEVDFLNAGAGTATYRARVVLSDPNTSVGALGSYTVTARVQAEKE